MLGLIVAIAALGWFALRPSISRRSWWISRWSGRLTSGAARVILPGRGGDPARNAGGAGTAHRQGQQYQGPAAMRSRAASRYGSCCSSSPLVTLPSGNPHHRGLDFQAGAGRATGAPRSSARRRRAEQVPRSCSASAPASRTEGLFFPDTYLFDRQSSELAVLRRAYQEMQRLVDTAWPGAAPICRSSRRTRH